MLPVFFRQVIFFIFLKIPFLGNFLTFVDNMEFKATSDGIIRLPALADVHVHFREPGYSYKETILSGSKAAAAGGYTAVCTMPNLNPPPDTPEHIRQQLDIIEKDAVIEVRPYATITVGRKGLQTVDVAALKEYCVAFSDDGSGVQNEQMMFEAMKLIAANGCILAAHCEDNSLLRGGYIHDGEYARQHGHKGISSESEWRQIERDLDLAARTGCSYHVCHISTKESVELIRRAKARGVDVTCETGPHYLILSDMELQEDARFKMNPPLRSPEDRSALIEGLLDGTIDMIATDHAPHSVEEKSRGLASSAMGIVGLETAFPLMYTRFVKTGILTIERLVELMSTNPRKRFRLGSAPDDFAEFDLAHSYTVNPEDFLSKGRSTPFEGWELYGRCVRTVYKGKTVFER